MTTPQDLRIKNSITVWEKKVTAAEEQNEIRNKSLVLSAVELNKGLNDHFLRNYTMKPLELTIITKRHRFKPTLFTNE